MTIEDRLASIDESLKRIADALCDKNEKAPAGEGQKIVEQAAPPAATTPIKEVQTQELPSTEALKEVATPTFVELNKAFFGLLNTIKKKISADKAKEVGTGLMKKYCGGGMLTPNMPKENYLPMFEEIITLGKDYE